MTKYTMLALKYLKHDLRRTIISVIGVTLVVMVLYGGLNLAYSFFLQMRVEERDGQDYEIVLVVEDEETAQQILEEPKVKSAYMAPYLDYVYDDENGWTEVLYPNAIYINTTNPYRMNAILSELQRKYVVVGDYNRPLAEFYFQGEEGSIWIVIVLLVLVIALIFSIFGVGIVRNGIHLSMLENIRDYGNLRCIGSSRQQLKRIVFLQGLYIEMIGIILGTVLGTMLSQVIRLILKQEGIIGGGGLSDLPAGFHVLPLLVVILEFLFDLYFIMDENVKMVTRMSPVSAIRGEYRYKLPKIKLREKNLFRRLSLKIFGLDGDYAFKNIMRHPGRFYRTIGAMIFGIAAFMGVGAAVHSMIARVQQQFEDAGYYQIYVYNEYGRDETIEQVESSLPPVENLTALSELNDITEAKRMYVAETYLPSPEPLVEHYSEDYLASDLGKRMKGIWDRMKSGEAPYRPDMFRNVLCYGYSAEDLARYQPVLTDGTLDVSPQGIILVNWAWTYDENPYSHTAGDEFDDYGVEYTDYQVGDTIELADVGELHKLLDEPLNELRMEKYELLTELSQDQNYNEEHSLSEFEGDYGNAETPQLAKAHMIDDEYKEKETELIADCERQLKDNGYYRTYTIEGIVSRDVNTEVDTQIGGSALRIIMPLEYYYTFTGTDESQPTGMMYHTDRLMPNMNQIWNALSMIEFDDSLYVSFDMGDGGSQIFSIMDTYTSTSGTYIGVVSEMSVILKWLLGGVAVVGFILLMFGLNMLNTTASNLYLRRSELAQLRVIGVSKKHLMRMVLLEGVIEVLIADVIGILIGGALSYGVFFILRILYQTKYYFPFFIAAVCIVLSVLVVCGAIYFPLRRMTNDLADDLKLGAE